MAGLPSKLTARVPCNALRGCKAMAWWKAQCESRTNPKFAAAGAAASWVWYCANCYAREHLTDGLVPKQMLSALVPGMTWRQVVNASKKLVEVKLFIENTDGSFTINDFLVYHPSKAEVENAREWDNRRKALYSDKQLIEALRRRDADYCRYCDCRVNWRDRRGPTGGQFDHVEPRGENSYDNVVVSCRRCNVKKNDRTPEQAGMPLLPHRGPDCRPNGTSSVFSSELDPDLFPHTRAHNSDSSFDQDLEEKKSHPIKELLAFHEQCFVAKNRGEKPAKYTAQDAKHAKDLIDRHGQEKARAIVRQAFVSADEFLARSGRSMSIIISSSVQNRLIAELAARAQQQSLESPAEHPHLRKVAGRV